MAEENKGAQKKTGVYKNKRRRRGGQSAHAQENKQAVETTAETGVPHPAQSAGQAKTQNRQGNGHSQNQRKRHGHDRGRRNNGTPARQLSDNVIVTDAESTSEASSTVPQPPQVEDKNRYRTVPDYWYEDEVKSEAVVPPEELIEIVGVRFKDTGKVYYFAPMGYECHEGMDVIVETARGIEYGTVSIPNKKEPPSALVAALRPVVRIATDADRERHMKNAEREAEAFAICAQKIEAHKLDMKLVEAEYTFDNSKLTFYFSADGRVDFRELVKDLASVFRTRIELRQIGIRDEAKLLGGIGICGRPFCCSTFLYDFNQVSIRMAKEQNLSLNSAKISGTCGRLMCCLRYECETYEEEMKRTPRIDSIVKTPDGSGFVIETMPLAGTVRVKLGDADDAVIKQYTRDEVTVIGRRRGHDKQDDEVRPENDTL